MTGWWNQFEQFLTTDPRDVGCDAAMGIMHVYVELLAEGVDPIEKFPGMSAHLNACEACAEDVQGLLAAVRDES